MPTKKPQYGADPKAKVAPSTGTTIAHCSFSGIGNPPGQPQPEHVSRAVSDLAQALTTQALAVQSLADVLKGTEPSKGNSTGCSIVQPSSY